MATFTVDPATLRRLAKTLSGLGGTMEGMKVAADSYEGLLGGRSLEAEIEHFAGTWDYGISLLDKHMKNVVNNLEKAAANYQASEHHIGQAAHSGSGSGTTTIG